MTGECDLDEMDDLHVTVSPTMKHQRKDATWKYVIEKVGIDGKRKCWSCTFCATTLKGGGIHRMKEHIACIVATVAQIMLSSVALALRMSGHLLYGVVRIYSKKVDYLYKDIKVIECNLNRCSPATIDPPEVILQQQLQLDNVELDINPYAPRDPHTSNLEDITLPGSYSFFEICVHLLQVLYRSLSLEYSEDELPVVNGWNIAIDVDPVPSGSIPEFLEADAPHQVLDPCNGFGPLSRI